MEFGFPELAAIRLGYGLSPHMKPPATADDLLAGVADAGPGPDAYTVQDARDAWQKRKDLADARDAGGEAEKTAFDDFGRELRRMNWLDLQRRTARAVDAKSGFGERLVQFWADHFTVRGDGAAQQPLALSFVDDAIRPHLNGRFEDMLFAADTHPMMLIYLNQVGSIGPNSPFRLQRPKRPFGLNENLAREALELHSLGVGAGYSQQDVRELAELLTGLTYNPRNPENFRPGMAEPGAETVLGKSYGGAGQASLDDIRAVFRDLARRPETAAHIARKLAVHFLSDDPDQGVVDAMAAVWRDTGGDLPQVYRVLVTHPALADSFRQKTRQPFDYIATSLRALGVTGQQVMGFDQRDQNRVLVNPIQRMGQRWGTPLGPNGWPEESEAWINPPALAARITWAMAMPRLLLPELPDPRNLLDVALGGTQSDALAWAVPKAESQREGVALILASNDFNRR